MSRRSLLLAAVVISWFPAGSVNSQHAAGAEDAQPAKDDCSIRRQRIVSAGHSFHMFVPPILSEIAGSAGIEEHTQVAQQGIGGSYVHQHWDVPDENNLIKQALRTGEVDVLALSPIYLPDDGIENFARLAVEHNPDIRVAVQEFWLPYDVYAKDFKKNPPEPVNRNSRTVKQIRELHAEYFKSMDEHVRKLNKQLDKPALCVIPAGQAVILLREKIIAGEAPGLTKQDDLFRDAIGHPTPPLRALVSYCHYAVIYRRSPVGLPVPRILQASPYREHADQLNRLLQELAWKAVQEHPRSGVANKSTVPSQ